MGVEILRGFAKEAIQKSVALTNFLCCLHLTNTYLFTLVLTYGPSMLPTLNMTGSLLLAERFSTRLGKVGRGDIVIVRSPVVPRRTVTKRIIGMEGDSVTYVVDPQNSNICDTIVVPKGHVWIEGDNIYDSKDSRNFGAVPYGLLEAKVFWRIWPPKDFGSLRQRAD
ncbi:Peptidase_S24 domain-containing protein [Cephalotus follicularis]|uniref:Peptidase_S24 domain-containing protein n=1 Tax=Cephalotus follicularis TaxID=3775 RepID=A0A1Q3B8K1_CEPFO|nr:Peptidase_S24 domain-containing protein [Cephalotus follicularis]